MSHTTTVKSTPVRDISALESAIAELQGNGVKIRLVRDTAPRMYYQDQLQKHLGRSSEVCDFVIQLDDCYYDIGLIKNDDGSYSPVFDDYDYPASYPASQRGRKSIKQILGAPFAGQVEHWSGNRADTDQTLHSIGKLMQGYVVQAVMNDCAANGHALERVDYDEQGQAHIHIRH